MDLGWGGQSKEKGEGDLVMLEWVWALKTEESESNKGVVGRISEELESDRGVWVRMSGGSFKEAGIMHVKWGGS